MHGYKWCIGVYMYIVVVQITWIYLGTPCCIVFPIQEGKGSLPHGGFFSAYNGQLNVDWVAPYRRYRCTEEWPIVSRIDDVVPDSLRERERRERERERERKICAQILDAISLLLGSFFHARRDKGKDIFYRYRGDTISLLIETARGARNF